MELTLVADAVTEGPSRPSQVLVCVHVYLSLGCAGKGTPGPTLPPATCLTFLRLNFRNRATWVDRLSGREGRL